MNNVVQTSTLITQPYLAVGQITSPYEQQKPVKDLNKYATLKAVGKTFLWWATWLTKQLLSNIWSD